MRARNEFTAVPKRDRALHREAIKNCGDGEERESKNVFLLKHEG
jgi:hypothetical protein